MHPLHANPRRAPIGLPLMHPNDPRLPVCLPVILLVLEGRSGQAAYSPWILGGVCQETCSSLTNVKEQFTCPT